MSRKKIGDLLIEKGLITPEQLEQCLREQAGSGLRLGEVLIDKGFITEEELVDTISQRLGIPRVSLASMVIDPEVIQRVPVDVARRYSLIPILALGNTLTLAMADPLNIIAIEHVKYRTGADIRRVIAATGEIKKAIDQYYSVADSLNEIVGSRQEDADRTRPSLADIEPDEAESPIIKLVNVIISKAVKDRASDIHIEPDESMLRIRYRVNGVMREEAAPSKSMQSEIITRIKIAADLDVSEKRVPQDGRFMMVVDGAPIDLRVSTMPTIHGEKIVIRILDRRNLFLSFPQLGFDADLEDAWRNLVYKPEGLILICGPTSSGKTSTLYTTLQEINSVEKNIITIEDPVEYSLPMINQIQINEKAGLTFPTTLRSILRQNPDIIMVGEVRDRETARMAIRSALTGHLVFSTVHTNDAASAITRLLDMGIEEYLVATALKGVLSQRLVRVNCEFCLDSYQPAEPLLRRAGLNGSTETIDFRHGIGCNQCRDTGFSGLVGIFELIGVTPTISELILNNAPTTRISQEARRYGYLPLFEAGMQKVRSGQVCLEELLKETSFVDEYATPQDGSMVQVRHAPTV